MFTRHRSRPRKHHQGRAIILPPGHEPRPDLVPLASGDEETLDSLSLVLASMGIDHYLDEEEGILLADEENSSSALAHIQRYQRENQGWPPPPATQPPFYNQDQPNLALMALLLLFFFHTGPWSGTNPWFALGASNSEAILQGHEWWRLVTALTLHADFVHVLSNCLLGAIMVHLLGQMTGYGLAWLLLVLGGATGNLLNILMRSQTHLSVGFSTSIFAAIGIFSGLQSLSGKALSIKNLLLSLAAGLALLAMLGTGGERTDLGAHLFGFLCGTGCGLFLGASGLTQKLLRPRSQNLLFLLALAIVALCWSLAWHSAPTAVMKTPVS